MIDNDGEITSQTTVTAETLAGRLRYDRFLTEHNSLFVAALASRDVPAGKDAVLGAQLGYSRQLYKTETAEAVAEFGYDYSHEDSRRRRRAVDTLGARVRRLQGRDDRGHDASTPRSRR